MVVIIFAISLFYLFRKFSSEIFVVQVLIAGDSIARGLSWHGFDVRPFPGITAEGLRNRVMMHFISVFLHYKITCD